MGDKNKKVSSNQQEKLIKIGAYLHRIRIENNISLARINKKTLIPYRLLQAIEAGKIDDLPELFYTKALIKKFARAIDAQEIDLQDLNELEKDLSYDSKVSNSRWYFPSFQIKPFHLYLFYISLITLSVKGITNFIERPIIVNRIEVAKQIPLESPVTINRPSPAQTATLVSQSPIPQSAVVNITLRDECWLKVVVDGKVEFEGTLPKGTNRTWKGKKAVTIRAGNAGGVFITFNNGQKKLLGKPGQVEEVTYTVN